jgi:hypothetical protein
MSAVGLLAAASHTSVAFAVDALSNGSLGFLSEVF